MNDSLIAREFLETGRSESCPVIDMHAHYGPFNGIYMPNDHPEQMIATMDRCGVETIVSSGHTALADMTRGNAEMAAITPGYPGRWYAYLVYNLCCPIKRYGKVVQGRGVATVPAVRARPRDDRA